MEQRERLGPHLHVQVTLTLALALALTLTLYGSVLVPTYMYR